MSHLMRIAHLTTVDISLRYLILPQLEAVNQLGGEAIGISAPGEFVHEVEQRGIRHIPMFNSTRSIDPVRDAKAVFELWKILRTERPDVLHTHTPKPGIYGRIVGRLAGVPVVVNTVHGLYATRSDGHLKRAIVYTLEAIASRFSDRELVQSLEDYEFLTRRRISAPTKTTLLGNGVDLKRFDRTRVSGARRSELRASIGAGPQDVVVGSVGRLVAEKGFPELFEAALTLREHCKVVVIGPEEPDKDDGLSSEIISAARDSGVQFLGMLSNVDEWYAAMDVFVLASHREGFPRAAMEAAATGLPVVATDIRGCREVVEHERNGLLVPVNDPPALGSAINQLADSEDLRTRMGEEATVKAAKDFDETEVVRIVMSAQISALRELGRETPLHGSDSFSIGFRRGTSADSGLIARLHLDNIATGFLPTLGFRFLRHLYRAMVSYKGSVLIVAEDPYGPVGFVSGVSNVGSFYKHFIKNKAFRAGLAAFPKLIRPSTWRKAWETLTYDSGHQETDTELLSMAVSRPYQRRGLGQRLVTELLEEFARVGEPRVKVVVGADNAPARKLYEASGFSERGTIEVHKGEESIVLVSDRSPE